MKQILTENEFKNCEFLATGRHFFKDQHNKDRDLVRWNNTQYEADVLGVIGEYVVSKALKIPFDMHINLEGDGGHYDLFLGEWSIQVKTTSYDNGYLIFNTLDEVKALINVLVTYNENKKTYNIVGYISKKDFMKHHELKNFNHGDRYCVAQNKLKEISNLIFYYNEWKFSSPANDTRPTRTGTPG